MIPLLPPHYTFRCLGIIVVELYLFWKVFLEVFLGFLGSSRPETKMDVMEKCWECSAVYGSLIRVPMKDFERHNDRFHADCLNKCTICPNRFNSYRDMVDHKKNDHVQFICIECFEDKGFEDYYTKEKLSRHYAKEHKYSKKKCGTCGNRFKLESSLQDHINLFHGPRSVPALISCVHCPHYSAVREDLDRHNASLHPKKKFPHLCPKCGNVFKKSGTRDAHKNKCTIRA